MAYKTTNGIRKEGNKLKVECMTDYQLFIHDWKKMLAARGEKFVLADAVAKWREHHPKRPVGRPRTEKNKATDKVLSRIKKSKKTKETEQRSGPKVLKRKKKPSKKSEREEFVSWIGDQHKNHLNARAIEAQQRKKDAAEVALLQKFPRNNPEFRKNYLKK